MRLIDKPLPDSTAQMLEYAQSGRLVPGRGDKHSRSLIGLCVFAGGAIGTGLLLGLLGLLVIGQPLATLGGALCVVGCGGSGGTPWELDAAIVGTWDLRGMTQDGLLVFFDPKAMVFHEDGTWRSDTVDEDNSWSTGTFRTRDGRLNYRINASSDARNVGRAYTYDYSVSGGWLTIEGWHKGHYYEAMFIGVLM